MRASRACVAARPLVDLDDGVALATLDRHRDDLLGQAALVGRGDRALVRAQRPAVEVGARELELVADLGRLVEHLRPLNGLVRPSWTMASSALASPMRKPKRAWGSR